MEIYQKELVGPRSFDDVHLNVLVFGQIFDRVDHKLVMLDCQVGCVSRSIHVHDDHGRQAETAAHNAKRVTFLRAKKSYQ